MINQNSLCTKKRYDRISKFYDLMEKPVEAALFRIWRAELFQKIKGKVLEIGVGTGKNIPYYPEGVSVVAIDISEKMMRKARKRAVTAKTKPKFALMDVQNLALEDGVFDTVVATFVFCSVPDPVAGLKELRRVCKPGAQVLLLEHVRSNKPWVGKLMDILNPFVVRTMGANINRNTKENIAKAGLDLYADKNLKSDIFKFFEIAP